MTHEQLKARVGILMSWIPPEGICYAISLAPAEPDIPITVVFSYERSQVQITLEADIGDHDIEECLYRYAAILIERHNAHERKKARDRKRAYNAPHSPN